MALTVAELNTRLTADAKQFNSTLNAASKSADRFEKDVSTASGGVGGAFKKLGVAGQAALGVAVAQAASAAAQKVVSFAMDSVKAASALQEQMTGTEVVFGKASDAVIAFAEETSGSLGLARSEALQAANSFGTFFKMAGATEESTAAASESLVRLAADLASFKDVAGGTPAVLDKLRAGLSGETEPLRTLGVFLSETAVKAKAAELGYQELGGQFTEGQKVAARYALIIEQTKDAQGDLARTSDSLANKQRLLSGDIKRLQEDLGKGLVPAASLVVDVFKGGVVVFGDTARAIGEVLDAAKNTGPLEDHKDAVDGALKSWAKVNIPGAGFVMQLAGIGRESNEAAQEQADLASEVELADEAMRGATISAEEYADVQTKMADRAMSVIDANRGLADANRGVRDAQESAGDAQRELNDLLARGAVNADDVRKAEEALADVSRDIADAHERAADARAKLEKLLKPASVQDLAEAADDVTKAQLDVRDSDRRLADSRDRLTELQSDGESTSRELEAAADAITLAEIRSREAVQGLAAAQEAQNATANRSITITDEVASAQRDLKEAEDAVAAAVRGQNEAQVALQSALAGDPGFAREVAAAQRDVRDARERVTSAQRDQRTSTIELAGAHRELKTGMDQQTATTWALIEAELEHGAIQGPYRGELQKTRQEFVDFDNSIAGMEARLTALREMGAVIGVTMGTNVSRAVTDLPRFHSGGVVPGPRGADVPIMAQAGETVVPAGGGGGGGNTYSITIQAWDTSDGGQKAVDAIRAYERRNGTAWRN